MPRDTVTPFPRPTPPRLAGAEGAAGSRSPAAPTDLATHRLRDALAAYDALNGRDENAYATLTAAARKCGCPVGSPVILWSREHLGQLVTPGLAGVVAGIVDSTSMDRVIGEEPVWARDSDNGAA